MASLLTLLARKDVAELAKPLDALIPNYNLANPRVRDLYDALSGDKVVKQPFWSEVKSLAERRHKIVHSGADASEQQARDGIAAAESLVAHVESVLRRSPT